MGISCKPFGKTKGIFAKLQNQLDAEVKAEKKAAAKETKKVTK